MGVTPDTGPPGPPTRRSRTTRPPSQRGLNGGGIAFLPKDRSTTDGNTDRARHKPVRTARAARWFPAILAAVAVGAILTFVEPSEHRFRATFLVTDESSPGYAAQLRADLLRCCSDTAQAGGSDHPQREQWFIDTPSPDSFRLCLLTTGRRYGLPRVKTMARDFLADVRARVAVTRSTPSEVQVRLERYSSRLEAGLRETEQQLEAIQASLPPIDPRAERRALLDRWASLRSSFTSARERLIERDAEVERLRSEPEPTHGIIPTEERRRALQANAALQQDLRELEVKLTEVKLELLKVWKGSADRLEQLKSAAGELIGMAPRIESAQAVDDAGPAVARLLEEARQYHDALMIFAEAWTDGLMRLREVRVDPLDPVLLDAHERTRKRLNGFLFHSGKRLSAMRASLRTVSRGSTDHARRYVIQSDLTRGFQTVQTAHHRFEFASGAIDTTNNFRLDSALRSARGLRRRSLKRIEAIDRRLQTEAADLARRQRRRELAEAERLVDETREEADTIIEELIAAQDALNGKSDESEAFVEAGLRNGVITSRIEQTTDMLQELHEEIGELQKQRADETSSIGVELVSCEMLPGAVNLPERIRTGVVGAVLTFLALIVVPWWVRRRP